MLRTLILFNRRGGERWQRERKTSVIYFYDFLQMFRLPSFVLIARPQSFKTLVEVGMGWRYLKGQEFQRRKQRPPVNEEILSNHTVALTGRF